MPELHLEVLRHPQQNLWEVLQGHSAILTAHGFLLAGGTALAMQIGHRESHDFDFFSQASGVEAVRTWLEGLPRPVILDADANTIHADVASVKLSFIGAYRYPFILPAVPAGNLMMADIVDIALMKMLAITHRATVRDYIDLAAIFRDHHPLSSLVPKSSQKYGDTFNIALCLRTMVHFSDLDEEMPVLLDTTLARNWKDILLHSVADTARQFGLALDS